MNENVELIFRSTLVYFYGYCFAPFWKERIISTQHCRCHTDIIG